MKCTTELHMKRCDQTASITYYVWDIIERRYEQHASCRTHARAMADDLAIEYGDVISYPASHLRNFV